MTAPVAGADAIPAPAATPAPSADRTVDRTVDRAAEIADTTAKIALYARVSRIAAAERDPRVAVGAAWATDVLTVQQLLAERAPAESDAAHQRFLAVATAVGAAVSGAVPVAGEAEPTRARDAREVVVAARRRMLGVFDASAAALIAERLTDLEHLAELPPAVGKALPSPGDALQWRAREIGPAGLIEALHVAASDGRLIAEALLAAGYRRDAARQMCLADVAEVEAYLVEASVAVGDDALLLADVRRGALVFLLSEAAERPVDVAAARAGVWAAVRAALPPAEVERLAPRLGRTRTAA